MLERRQDPAKPQGRISGFMYDHGRIVADGASYVRLGLGVASAIAVLTDRYKLAQGLHFAGIVTDKFDGTVAGMSKDGKTKAGGKLDQRIDKAFTAVTESALALKNDIGKEHPILRSGRDVVMNTVVRPASEKQGIDTSAVMSGQVSTAVVLIVDNLSMSPFGREHPRVMKGMHWLATGLKWYSMADSPRVWRKRHEMRQASSERVVYDSTAA